MKTNSILARKKYSAFAYKLSRSSPKVSPKYRGHLIELLLDSLTLSALILLSQNEIL